VIGTFDLPPDILNPDRGTYAAYTSSELGVVYRDSTYQIRYRPRVGRSIVNAATKFGGITRSGSIIILLDDGSIDVLSATVPQDLWVHWLPPGNLGYEAFERIVGDAVYTLSSSVIRVTRDDGKTWQVDVDGLHGDPPTDIAIDTMQYAYATTSGFSGFAGLYRQHPDSNIWRNIGPVPNISLSSVFVDRRQRVYVGSKNNGVYFSTNYGSSWTNLTAGMGNVQILKFSDDAFGNVYAMNGGGFAAGPVYRSIGGTQPWARIDGGLISLAGQGTIIVNSIAGDTLLVAASNFGAFTSSDQGSSWKEINDGPEASNLFGFTRTQSGAMMVSVEQGIFGRQPMDTSWKKVLPSAGYLYGLTLQAAKSGELFAVYHPNSTSFTYFVSTDNGNSWNSESSGMPPFSNNPLFVDEAGTRHLVANFSGRSYCDAPYVKKRGGSWTIDTTGVTMVDYGGVASYASNGLGWVYMSGTYPQKMLKRPIGGGAWTPDSAGLASVQALYGLIPDKSGNMVGYYFSSLFRQQGGAWKIIPKPSVLPASANHTAISVDSSGAIVAAFSQGFPVRGAGVYYTSNGGTTWTKFGLDSIIVTQLVSYGDTTFALTKDRGMYILTKGTATVVREEPLAEKSFYLSQNYPNPFNPSTQFRFSILESGPVRLTVFDVLGREVAVPVHQSLAAGQYGVTFNASGLASGVYFYRLEAGHSIEVKRMLVLK
jgi:hypothetical protein